jgi:hypothetical protein
MTNVDIRYDNEVFLMFSRQTEHSVNSSCFSVVVFDHKVPLLLRALHHLSLCTAKYVTDFSCFFFLDFKSTFFDISLKIMKFCK